MLKQIDKDAIKEIAPSMIYNRYDLWEEIPNYIVLDVNGIRIPIRFLNKKACEIGCWGMTISNDDLQDIYMWLFKNKKIKKIHILRAVVEKNEASSDDYVVPIPASVQDVDNLISKKELYNLNRARKKLTTLYGGESFVRYSVKDPEANRIIDLFWTFKKITYNSIYQMSESEYADKYHISHVYELKYGNKIVAVLLACEQCENVFLENFSYDIEQKKWSPGMIIYNLWIKQLVELKKNSIYLGGGTYIYKKKYGSLEQPVLEMDVFCNSITKVIFTLRNGVRQTMINVLPDSVMYKIHRIKNRGLK